MKRNINPPQTARIMIDIDGVSEPQYIELKDLKKWMGGDGDDDVVELTTYPAVIAYDETGGSQTFQVFITGSDNPDYEIAGLPSWLHIENKTPTTFDMVAGENTSENNRPAEITVRLTGDPDISAQISVTQEGKFLTEIIFQITTTQPDETPGVCIKLSASEGNGEASVQWEENGTWESADVVEGEITTIIPDDTSYPPFQIAIRRRKLPFSVRHAKQPNLAKPYRHCAHVYEKRYRSHK